MARGDHIYVTRHAGYTHHGIDCGDGTVIHFSGEPGVAKLDARITRSSLEEFLVGGKLRVREYGKRSSPNEAVAHAESKLGDTGYHLVTNNCEHFATWCCTGRPASRQVHGLGSLTAQGAVATTTVVATSSVIAAAGVQGVSAAGIMSALASAGGLVGGGAAVGPAVIGLAPAIVTVGITQIALRDDESLPRSERRARRDGRAASFVGAGAGGAVGVAAVSAMGVTSGLSAAGIASGLSAVGTLVGGGMLVGATVVAAAPVVAAAGAAVGTFLISRSLRRRADRGQSTSARTDTSPTTPGDPSRTPEVAGLVIAPAPKPVHAAR